MKPFTYKQQPIPKKLKPRIALTNGRGSKYVVVVGERLDLEKIRTSILQGRSKAVKKTSAVTKSEYGKQDYQITIFLYNDEYLPNFVKYLRSWLDSPSEDNESPNKL